MLSVHVSHACTAVAVGKDASASGHPIIAHSQDSGSATNDVRLVRVPRKQWLENSMRPLYNWQAGYPRVVSKELRTPDYAPFGEQVLSKPLGHIPQVPETWAYWDTDYAVQNEWGVSIGESTCGARTVGWPSNLPYGYNKAGIEDLTKIALERCKTARCAAETMGSIAVENGFYSADSGEPSNPAYDGSSECLAIGDANPGEIWLFNVMTGKNNASAIWVAQRVPDDHVAVVANGFTIRKMNLSDSHNFLYSPKVTALAEEMGWWTSNEETSPEVFDFFGAYGYTPSAENDRNIASYYTGRRMWRGFSLLSPQEGAKLDPNTGHLPHTPNPYPSSVPAPKHTITQRMVMDLYRDHYEGTPYDLTKGLASGPYGNPNRGKAPPSVFGQWERAMSMYRATWSFILEAKPHQRSVTWFGWDAPHGTAYLPFFGAASDAAPASYHSREGNMSHFSTKVAFWAFALVNSYSDVNFQLINKDVLERAHKIEKEGVEAVASWEAEADTIKGDDAAAIVLLTQRSNAFANKTVEEWWPFAFSLFAKFNRWRVTYNESANGEDVLFYPEWWLRSPEVGFTSWKPHGPFHGVLLDERATERMALLQEQVGALQEQSSRQFWMWCMIVVCCSLVASFIGHKAAVCQFKTKTDSNYILFGA